MLKVDALANLLEAHDVTWEDAAALDDSGWHVAAQVAKVNPPSPLTRSLVVDVLRDRERRAVDTFDQLFGATA